MGPKLVQNTFSNFSPVGYCFSIYIYIMEYVKKKCKTAKQEKPKIDDFEEEKNLGSKGKISIFQ